MILRACRRIFAILLILLIAVPLYDLSGESTDLKFAITPHQWLLSLFIVASLGWLFARFFPRGAHTCGCFLLKIAHIARSNFLLLCSALGALTSWYCFEGKAHLIDIIVQRMQANFFAAGMVAAPAPPLPGFFITQHMLVDGGQWYAQYAPIHSAVLSLGVIIRMPWLVGVLLAALGGWFVIKATVRLYGEQVGAIAALFFLISPFFLAMAGSQMNHVTAFFLMGALLWAVVLAVDRSTVMRYFVVGILLGLGAATRSLEFIAVTPLLVLIFFPIVFRHRLVLAPLFGLIGAVIGSSPYLLYNAATTGNPLLPGFLKLWGPGHDIGFHVSPWGESHTFALGLLKQLINVALLHEYLFDSLIPALFPLGLFLLLTRRTSKIDALFLAGFLSQPLAYVFYWHRDSFLGPRYLFVGLVVLLPLLARACIWIGNSLPNRKFVGVGPKEFAASCVALSLLYSLVIGIPTRFTIYHSGLKSFKKDIATEAQAAGIEQGLIFVPVSYGARIISNLRELQVPAWVVEQVYRSTDHCELGALTERFLRDRPPLELMTRELHELAGNNRPVTKVLLNQDKTLRMYVDRGSSIPRDCADEIAYDREGYTIVEPHLISNRPRLDGELVIARDLRSRNSELAALYPQLPAYLYRNGAFSLLRSEE